MTIIDNNKQLSSTEERDILDIMTSPDEQAKIDLLKLRVLVEKDNDFSIAIIKAFHSNPLLKSKAEQVKHLLFQSAVRGNGILREYKKRAGTTNLQTATDSEYISILQAGMVTCEDIQCGDERDLLKGHRGEWVATHHTYYAADADLRANTFNKMIDQLKIAGYEGKKIENVTQMLHILLDFMIKIITPFAQGKEIIPPLAKTTANSKSIKEMGKSSSTPTVSEIHKEKTGKKNIVPKTIQTPSTNNTQTKEGVHTPSHSSSSKPSPGKKSNPPITPSTQPARPENKKSTSKEQQESQKRPGKTETSPKIVTNIDNHNPKVVTIDFTDNGIEGQGRGPISHQVTYDFLNQQGWVYNTLPDQWRGEAACSGYAQRLLIGQFGVPFLREVGLLPEKKQSGETLCDAWQISSHIQKKGLGTVYGDLSSQIKIGQRAVARNSTYESGRQSLIAIASTPESKNGFIHLHNSKTSNWTKVQNDKTIDKTPNTHTSYVMGVQNRESQVKGSSSLRTYILSTIRKRISGVGGRSNNNDRLHLVKYLKNVKINDKLISYNEKQKDFIDTTGKKITVKSGDIVSYEDTMVAHYVNNKPQLHGLLELTIGGVYTPIQGIQRDSKKVPQRHIDYTKNQSLGKFIGAKAISSIPQAIAYNTEGKNNSQLMKHITSHYKNVYGIQDDTLCQKYTQKTINYLVEHCMRDPNMTLRPGDRILIPDWRYNPDKQTTVNVFECLDILSKPINMRNSFDEGEWMGIAMGHAGKEGISRRAKTQIMMIQLARFYDMPVPKGFIASKESSTAQEIYTIDGDFGPQSYTLMEALLAKHGYKMSQPRKDGEKLRITQSDIALFHKLYDGHYTDADKKSGWFLNASDIQDPSYVFRDAQGESLPGIYRGLHTNIICNDLFRYQDDQGQKRTDQKDGSFLTAIIDDSPFWEKIGTNIRNAAIENFTIILEELNKLMTPENDRTADGQPTPNNMIKAQILSTYLLETGTKEGRISGEVIKERIASIFGADSSTGPYEHQPRVVANLIIKYGNGAFLEEFGIPREWEGKDPHDPNYRTAWQNFLKSPAGQEALSKIKTGVRDIRTATKLVYLGWVDRIRNENNFRNFISQQNQVLPAKDPGGTISTATPKVAWNEQT